MERYDYHAHVYCSAQMKIYCSHPDKGGSDPRLGGGSGGFDFLTTRNPRAALSVQPGGWVTVLSGDMGNTSLVFRLDANAMSVEPAELQTSEVDTPSVFTGLIQTNRLAAQHVTHINEAALPFDRAGIAHARHDKAARVFNLRHSRRVCARLGLVEPR